MLEYDKDKKLYLVKRVFVPNKLLNQKSNTALNGGDNSNGESDDPSDSGSNSDNDGHESVKTTTGVTDSHNDIHYWVPRVRLMFAAENPKEFAKRVATAYYLRENTESLLRYTMYTCTIHVYTGICTCTTSYL